MPSRHNAPVNSNVRPHKTTVPYRLQIMTTLAITQMLAQLLSVLIIKIVAMIIGYRIVKLGYDALLRGIKGEFDFGGKVTGKIELKLLSASPGLFFVLFGSSIIIWSLAVSKPVLFEAEVQSLKVKPATSLQPEQSEPMK